MRVDHIVGYPDSPFPFFTCWECEKSTNVLVHFVIGGDERSVLCPACYNAKITEIAIITECTPYPVESWVPRDQLNRGESLFSYLIRRVKDWWNAPKFQLWRYDIRMRFRWKYTLESL